MDMKNAMVLTIVVFVTCCIGDPDIQVTHPHITEYADSTAAPIGYVADSTGSVLETSTLL